MQDANPNGYITLNGLENYNNLGLLKPARAFQRACLCGCGTEIKGGQKKLYSSQSCKIRMYRSKKVPDTVFSPKTTQQNQVVDQLQNSGKHPVVGVEEVTMVKYLNSQENRHIQEGTFLYGIRLHGGPYLQGVGKSWQEAAINAGADLFDVKRTIPVRKVNI